MLLQNSNVQRLLFCSCLYFCGSCKVILHLFEKRSWGALHVERVVSSRTKCEDVPSILWQVDTYIHLTWHEKYIIILHICFTFFCWKNVNTPATKKARVEVVINNIFSAILDTTWKFCWTQINWWRWELWQFCHTNGVLKWRWLAIYERAGYR